eukprot:TRINITY_DN21142_c0_g1_i1.p1 TRINITY_DN21142_c0_g1~~TRINITY_DN21142_c0_g1_i1.p1  ORF type:complete len:338 (+),score=60.09 TRINITY_DN21142_c0_g1_i1:68-1081(+)
MRPRKTKANHALALCAAAVALTTAEESEVALLDTAADSGDAAATRRALKHPVLSWKMSIRKRDHEDPEPAAVGADDGLGAALLQESEQRHSSYFSSLSEASSSSSSSFFSSSASWGTAASGVEHHSERKSSSREGWSSDGKSAREDEASAKSWVVDADKQVHKGLARRWQRNEIRHGDHVGITSFDGREAVSRDKKGALHTGGRFLRSEAVSDGLEVRREQVSKACVDGHCKEKVQPQAASLVEGRPDGALDQRTVAHGEDETAEGLSLGSEPGMQLMTVDKMKKFDQALNGIVRQYLHKAQLETPLGADGPPDTEGRQHQHPAAVRGTGPEDVLED